MNPYSTGISNAIKTTPAPKPPATTVIVERPAVKPSQLFGLFTGSVFSILYGALFLWIVAAVFVPTFGLTYAGALLITYTFKVLTARRSDLGLWTKAPDATK